MKTDDVKKLLTFMTEDMESNIKKIKSLFGSLDYVDEDKKSILHILVMDIYDERNCFLAIKSLLYIGLNPNLKADHDYNFIQTAMYAGYSEEFILNIITESLKYNLNVNHVDSEKNTMMYTAINSENYSNALERIFNLLFSNGYDYTKVCLGERYLLETTFFQKNNSKEQVGRFWRNNKEIHSNIVKDSQNKEIKNGLSQVLSDKDISELERYGKVLNNTNYIVAPTIGREKELKNLMVTLAQDKKNPLIVGESGVGKTAIVDELVYRINTRHVPNFLQNKIILEVNPSDVVAGCKYLGMFEDNMSKLMKKCEKLDVIVFIDEIHTIYGVGTTKNSYNDMASMLKYYIDRSNLKVIGITTEKEYNEFFSEESLKRRFEKIIIKEPAEEILYQIIVKAIQDSCMKNEIYFEDENIINQIANIIISATEKKHRVYNDGISNPDLAISIIDKAFALAKVYDSKFVTTKHFSESFEYCNRIYETTRELAIAKLKSLDSSKSKSFQKVLRIDFNKKRK